MRRTWTQAISGPSETPKSGMHAQPIAGLDGAIISAEEEIRPSGRTTARKIVPLTTWCRTYRRVRGIGQTGLGFEQLLSPSVEGDEGL